MNESYDWVKNLPVAITVTDENNILNYMNEKSIDTFKNEGGIQLIGSDLMKCHNENSKLILEEIIKDRKSNIYTIEKKGKKKLIYQAPVYDGDKYMGLVELSIELPENMQHFNRD